ncbi:MULTISPECIES: Na(+)/H(+) antiporter subunit B [Lysinibacillus]|uniref:Monovalent cation/H+ antiporter subunit B n=2 Tax=Lysinibacillus TaxID=400634 RepID=A0A0K9F1G1_9BACI|nr:MULTISPECIES: Na(+)/H(+) antiporter subunit B [Lysinibacillus]KMY28395.1 monovalent cation/H+ antiporter subunit B [Lysinibacillus xylanilyticus]MBG9456307.1 monovalent cation/H+ antiporter subunit B [Lysinibacillus sphaericus]MBG9479290.1 monovalent cation/H+ antiporter subunit B [Lysinibacillus sphaericus]MBG9594535.1 monovalent cation/H+ antiporter subunit B [Lysinibacillus sphaericus]MDD1503640.1 Na(+)/H(+) antiporter subunit B [Lysinibacillus sp. CNPSo 3705]
MKTNDVIIQFTTKIVFFIIFFFSIHIFLAGHYTPGGGFVGGLLTSSAIVLLVLAFDLNTVRKVLPINYTYLTAIGLLLALATAAFPMFVGKPFFTHFFDYFDLPLLGKQSLHTAMLFDSGVYLVVVGVTMTIIQTIGEDE